jgi:hypothetical protein
MFNSTRRVSHGILAYKDHMLVVVQLRQALLNALFGCRIL